MKDVDFERHVVVVRSVICTHVPKFAAGTVASPLDALAALPGPR